MLGLYSIDVKHMHLLDLVAVPLSAVARCMQAALRVMLLQVTGPCIPTTAVSVTMCRLDLVLGDAMDVTSQGSRRGG